MKGCDITYILCSTIKATTPHHRRRRRRRNYSPNLHTKLKPIKKHVMDGYQKGHMAIQAGSHKKSK